jgi:hypothetical protein
VKVYERGPRGKYSWVLIPTHILKIVVVYKPSNFILSVSKSQSLNTCKRVDVKSHIPCYESMGVE